MPRNIYVTRPLLPPLEEFIPLLKEIWKSNQLTNAGPFHQRLEIELARYLEVNHLALFANGTLALITALKALNITGEVITTPYSFVAPSHALLWNNIEPVFVDINPQTLNLDPDRIEEAITPRTTAIMPVHVYGRPCHVDRIQKIAAAHGLRVVYDAAHGFGVRYRGESLLRHGDLSVLSFHATKVFNTFEGGAIVCPDAETKERIDYLKNFGFVDEVTVTTLGINGKMNELQAAFGLLQLRHIDAAIARRREIDILYRERLKDVPGIRMLPLPPDCQYNHAYFPILVEANYPLTRDALNAKLRGNLIFTRRYFYPLISDFAMYRGLASAAKQNLPVAGEMAGKVLCLPIYPALSDDEVETVVQLVRE